MWQHQSKASLKSTYKNISTTIESTLLYSNILSSLSWSLSGVLPALSIAKQQPRENMEKENLNCGDHIRIWLRERTVWSDGGSMDWTWRHIHWTAGSSPHQLSIIIIMTPCIGLVVTLMRDPGEILHWKEPQVEPWYSRPVKRKRKKVLNWRRRKIIKKRSQLQ